MNEPVICANGLTNVQAKEPDEKGSWVTYVPCTVATQALTGDGEEAVAICFTYEMGSITVPGSDAPVRVADTRVLILDRAELTKLLAALNEA